MRFITLITFALLLIALPSCQDEIISGSSVDKIEIETRGLNDVFLMFHRGSTNQQIYAQKYDESAQGQTVQFETAYQLPANIRTKTVPEAMVHNGEVFLYWKGEANTDIYMSRASIEDAENGNGSGWSQPIKVLDGSGCERSPAIVRFNNVFYMFHEDAGFIKYHSSTDGVTWGNLTVIQDYELGNSGVTGTNGLIGNQHHKFAVAVLENRLYCFFVGSGDFVRYLSAVSVPSSPTQLHWQVPIENGTSLPTAGIQTHNGLEKAVINSNKLYLVFSGISSKTLTTKSCYVDRVSDGKLSFGGNTGWNSSCGSTAGALSDDDRVIITYRDRQRPSANIESSTRNINQYSSISGQPLVSDLTDGSSVDGTDVVQIR